MVVNMNYSVNFMKYLANLTKWDVNSFMAVWAQKSPLSRGKRWCFGNSHSHQQCALYQSHKRNLKVGENSSSYTTSMKRMRDGLMQIIMNTSCIWWIFHTFSSSSSFKSWSYSTYQIFHGTSLFSCTIPYITKNFVIWHVMNMLMTQKAMNRF